MDKIFISKEENKIVNEVFDAAHDVLEALGAGLLESAYERCLVHELRLRGYEVEEQVPLALTYKGLIIDDCYRLDILVNKKVVVEVKAVSEMKDIFKYQLNTYLKLTNCNIGVLLNFNVRFIGEGFTRWVVRK